MNTLLLIFGWSVWVGAFYAFACDWVACVRMGAGRQRRALSVNANDLTIKELRVLMNGSPRDPVTRDHSLKRRLLTLTLFLLLAASLTVLGIF